MKRSSSPVVTFGAVLVVFFSAGCTTSPDSLCNHLIKLTEQKFGELDKEGAGMRDTAMRSCVAEKSALKKSDPKAYDCLADCVTSKKNLVDVVDCEGKCGIASKKPKAAEVEEPVEGIPGLWTDPYADAGDASD